MKKFKYLGWDVFLFTQDCDGIPLFFAAMTEMLSVCSSYESHWDAFQKLRKELDDIERICAEEGQRDEGLPF